MMPANPSRNVFVVCSSAASGLGWPESVHATLEAAQRATEAAVGHPLHWIPDPSAAGTWNTRVPDDWMIREIAFESDTPTD